MCENHDHELGFDGQSVTYRRVLWIVIFINFSMFVIEMSTGALTGSKALQADALDFAGDAATYAISLWVIGKPLLWRSRAATFKGGSLLLMGVFVVISTVAAFDKSEPPLAGWMAAVTFMALLANVISAVLLMKFREGDANVRSVWLCSRNDAIGNVGVLIAAGLVAWLHSPWPDLFLALLMATLFVSSAWSILRQARQEQNSTHQH
jgi:cation diffusion facilitator family transporter